MPDQYRGFHESYYEHSCPIIPEQDVLHTDIIGRGCFAAVKRWWNDLFLLSATNESSKGFYNSSHAMRIERFKQYRKYKSRIHPMSKFTNFWNTIILLALIMQKILIRFTSAIILDNIYIFYFYFGAFLEAVIVLDLYVNLKTGYIDEHVKKVVLDTEMCLVNYCSKKLFLHCIAATPAHWLMFLKYGSKIQCGLCKFNQFICVIKIMSVFGLYRVVEMSSYWSKKRFSPNIQHLVRFCRIGLVGLVSMLQFYEVVDVVWSMTMIHTQTLATDSFIGKLIFVRYGAYKNVPNYLILCFDIARIFKSLLLFSFSSRYSSYSMDNLSSVVAYVIANSFYAWSLLECYSMVSCVVYPRDKLINAKKSIMNLLVSRQLSDDLMCKIEQYFDFSLTSLKILERDNGLFKSLPDVLRKEAILSCYTRLIMKIPLFSEWPLPLIQDLALLLKPEVYLSGDIVSQAWVEGHGLMIVDVGVLAVYSIYQEETGHLIDGDFFGEVSLFTDKEASMSYVTAVTSCRMLVLDKSKFREFMRQESKIFNEMRIKIENRFKPKDGDEIESPPTLGTARKYNRVPYTE